MLRDSISRRSLLTATAATAAGALTACASSRPARPREGAFGPVPGADRARPAGATREFRLTAVEGPVDLGGEVVRTWSYDGYVPGPTIRASAGETLQVRVVNHLPAATTAHWHGVVLPNAQDGVPGLTQDAIAPGAEFTYAFELRNPGTYWFHPHVGTQQDRGLYAPLIVDDPREPLAYDTEWVVVLDDWIDGTGTTPDDVLADLTGGRATAHTAHAARTAPTAHAARTARTARTAHDPAAPEEPASDASPGTRAGAAGAASYLGGHAGDVAYPYHLVNGRPPADPETFRADPGTRVRLRVINAGGDTAYRVALGGHRLTVTHTDGLPVEHTEVACLLLGMGERYDAIVELDDGVFPLVAVAEGKEGAAFALVRTSSGQAPGRDARPAELDTPPLDPAILSAAPAARPVDRPVDRTIRMELTGGRPGYTWGINGRAYDPAFHHAVASGERVRLEFVNHTPMWHPMHVHGHVLTLGGGHLGALKDTVAVLPGRTVRADFDADNPGRWMVHCHNVYHSEAGMMTVLGYE